MKKLLLVLFLFGCSENHDFEIQHLKNEQYYQETIIKNLKTDLTIKDSQINAIFRSIEEINKQLKINDDVTLPVVGKTYYNEDGEYRILIYMYTIDKFKFVTEKDNNLLMGEVSSLEKVKDYMRQYHYRSYK